MSDDRVVNEPAEAPDNRGPAIIAEGSVLGGFKFIGPFETIDAACEWYRTSLWCAIKHPITIALLEKPAGAAGVPPLRGGLFPPT